jgi:O-antigen/teichoic acid export membrane protein
MLALLRKSLDSSSREAIAYLGYRFALVGLEFLAGVALARMAGIEQFGVYVLVVSVVTLIALPAAAGLDRLLIREVAIAKANQQWGVIRGLINRGVQVAIAAAISLSVGVFLAISSAQWQSVPLSALAVGLLAVPCVSVLRVKQAAMQGFGDPASSLVPELIQQLAFLAGLLAIATLSTARHGTVFLSLYATCAVLAVGVASQLTRSVHGRILSSASPIFATKSWLRQAIPFLFIVAMSAALTNVDVLIVGLLEGARESALYRTASQISLLATLPVTAVNMVAAPQLAQLHAQGNTRALQKLVRRTSCLMLLLSASVASMLWLIAPYVLKLYGTQFLSAQQILSVLLVGHVGNALMGVSGYLLLMTRHDASAAVCFTFAVAAQILGCIVLVAQLGAIGAAVATSFTMVALGMTFAWITFRKLGVHSSALSILMANRS